MKNLNNENTDKWNERANNNNKENHTGYMNIALAYELANKNNEKNKPIILDNDGEIFLK